MSDNLDDMIEKIKNNSKEENKKLAEDMKNSLSGEQKSALDKVLSDSNLLKKIMNNDKVQEIIKKLGGEANGHQ